MKFKWDKKYLHWGVTAFLVIVCSILFFWLVSKFSGFLQLLGVIVRVLSPFLYGLLIAYLLNGLMTFFEKRLFAVPARKIARGDPKKEFRFRRNLSILLAHLLAVSAVVGLFVLVLPQLFTSMKELVTSLPGYAKAAEEWVNRLPSENKQLEGVLTTAISSASEWVTKWFNDSVLPQIDSIVATVTGSLIVAVKAVFNVVMGAVISVYILYHKETFRAQAKRALYSLFKTAAANRIMSEAGFVKKAFGDFIMGNFLDAIVIGVLNYIFMLIMGMPYIALISVIVGVTNMIPIFGPIIGGIPSVLLVLLVDPTQGLIFGVFTVVLQMMDSQVIKPKILGGVSGMSGFWIMFAILVFGGLFGIWGMLLGVPLLTVLYNALDRFHRRRLLQRGLPSEAQMYEDIDTINPATGAPVYRAGVRPAQPAADAEEEPDENPRPPL